MGPLAWLAQNPVLANLIMFVVLIGGLFTLSRVKQEVFPEFDLDFVSVAVAYPGASPAEVEQAVLLSVEEEVRGIDGVKEVTSTASEGIGSVQVELLLGSNRDRMLADVKSAVDRITTFPDDVERPIVSLVALRREVVSLGGNVKFTFMPQIESDVKISLNVRQQRPRRMILFRA